MMALSAWYMGPCFMIETRVMSCSVATEVKAVVVGSVLVPRTVARKKDLKGIKLTELGH